MINKNITLESIGGYECQKDEAYKIVNFFKNYDKYIKNGAKLPRGIVFYGRPGTGKTMFATAIANESQAKLYSLTDEKFYDDTNLSTSVHNIFKIAKQNAPSIILIDEIDQLVYCDEYGMSSPTDKQREMLRLLLTEIDKLEDDGVLVIATANTSLYSLPSPLVRNGRIEKHISINTPDSDDRKSILNIYLNKSPLFKKIKASELSKITQGFTGSSISSLVNDVLIKCLSQNKSEASYKDFYDPIQIIISNGIKKKANKNNDDVIYHEIGHLVTNYFVNKETGIINTESYGESEGRFYRTVKNEDAQNLKTLADIENKAIIDVAGLAATEIFLKKKYIGAVKDLADVLNLFNFANRNGLISYDLTCEQIVNSSREFPKSENSQHYSESFQKFMKNAYDSACKILCQHDKLVKIFFDTLKDKKCLSTEEVDEIISNYLKENKESR